MTYCILSGPRKVNWKHYKLRYNDRPLAFIIFWQRGFPNYLLKLPGLLLKSSIFPARLVFYCSSAEFGSLPHIFHFHCYGNLVQQSRQSATSAIQSSAPATNLFSELTVFLVYVASWEGLVFFVRYPVPKPCFSIKNNPTQTIWNSEEQLTLEFSWEHNFLACFCSVLFTLIEVFGWSL